jgi:uncharacterized protein YdeI (YjbR/CyaY-like superfamily)
MATLHVTKRDAWRAWLAEHHASETEIWLIFHKKHSGQPRVSYDDAVEEALCFGWVDSIVKRIDDDKYAQKFSPRRDWTKWSESNKKRMLQLIADGRMTKAGTAQLDLAVLREPPPAKPSKDAPLPRFVKQALMASPKAWEFFQGLAPSYRRDYLAWIMDAKKEETRQRRLREAVSLLEQNKKLGMK